ncbi:preprotein translocase subunit SecY [Akkermansiaceae bacterium]|jgi:preprotein translocase subunit SecY|nr:preprotein translocase subunit SecY [Akkermansiaceae bacterium]MDB4403888.1 preprotein translocase subunit SecY [Akkermansiaceae bacterium]MDB4520262.1 preprotein translocase subunit SecY [Akkermansiaceae bacterium]|tara:strand:+ start:6323 stop:7828 length:1506 start_codon:yes stop_codon:yes gene_type:complete
MISAFANTWKIPELRDRILFTMAMIVIVRLGVAIPLPGVNMEVISTWLDIQAKDNADGAGGGIGAILNVFSGGGLQAMGLFSLGIMPYISASIMMQLLSAVVPKLARLKKQDGGQQKINSYTRYVTIVIATVQGFFLAKSLDNPESNFLLQGIGKAITQVGSPLIPEYGPGFIAMTVLIIVCGTLFLMWVGDQITERGIGNGISLIISVNIISALPGVIVTLWDTFVVKRAGNAFSPLLIVLLVVLFLLVIAAVIAITQAQRRIAVQYARRVAGRREMAGGTQYLPLKVNYAGVMPVIFATAILQLPATIIGGMFPNSDAVRTMMDLLSPNDIWFYIISGTMIFFFSFFWVATMFQPSEIAENLKKGGGYIPGVRPGKPTSDFLDYTMTRLTFAGAIFLTLIFMLPYFIGLALDLGANSLVTSFFGGTSLLILVGVLLDMMRQIETHLLQRHYDGFLRKGKIKGRNQRAAAGAQASSSSVIYLWTILAVIILVAIVASLYN